VILLSTGESGPEMQVLKILGQALSRFAVPRVRLRLHLESAWRGARPMENAPLRRKGMGRPIQGSPTRNLALRGMNAMVDGWRGGINPASSPPFVASGSNDGLACR